MAHDIFISYSQKNKEMTLEILDLLEKNGIKCWIAPRDVKPGAVYAGELTRGIKSSRMMLLIYSQDSSISPHVTKEINIAVSKGIAILPFKIDNCELNETMEYYLSDYHWIDAQPDPEKFYNKLVSYLNMELHGKQASTTSSQSTSTKKPAEKSQNTDQVEIDQSNAKYVGQAKNGVPNGTGTYYFKNGDTYEGGVKEDHMHGKGKYTWESGSVYTGEWIKDRRSGYGEMTWPKGSKYTGEWKDGNRNGNGTMTWHDGAEYTGQWSDDKQNGIGTYHYKNGDVYEGNFVNNLAHGKGELKRENGDSYLGEFSKGEKNGFGVFKWNDGAKYEGDFKEGYRWGQGTYFFSNGNQYTGDFLKGKRTGKGIYIYKKSGLKYEGDFLDNKYHGTGTLYYPKGRFVGEFRDGQANGKAHFYYENGDVETCNMLSGQKDGMAVIEHESGMLTEETWKDGKCIKKRSYWKK